MGARMSWARLVLILVVGVIGSVALVSATGAQQRVRSGPNVPPNPNWVIYELDPDAANWDGLAEPEAARWRNVRSQRPRVNVGAGAAAEADRPAGLGLRPKREIVEDLGREPLQPAVLRVSGPLRLHLDH